MVSSRSSVIRASLEKTLLRAPQKKKITFRSIMYVRSYGTLSLTANYRPNNEITNNYFSLSSSFWLMNTSKQLLVSYSRSCLLGSKLFDLTLFLYIKPNLLLEFFEYFFNSMFDFYFCVSHCPARYLYFLRNYKWMWWLSVNERSCQLFQAAAELSQRKVFSLGNWAFIVSTDN